MSIRRIRYALLASVAVLGIALAAGNVANAEGQTDVQQSDGSSQTYRHVHMRLDGRTLFLSSPDRKDVLEVSSDACSYAGDVQRCLPFATTLHRHGRTHTIALSRGTVYLNLGSDVAHLPHSSRALGPHQVLVHLHTRRGTFISAQGTLDGVKGTRDGVK